MVTSFDGFIVVDEKPLTFALTYAFNKLPDTQPIFIVFQPKEFMLAVGEIIKRMYIIRLYISIVLMHHSGSDYYGDCCPCIQNAATPIR